MTAKRRKWALVTGAERGSIGEAETAAFMKRGVNVISASMNSKGIEYLNPGAGSDAGFVVTMPLDVTSAESIASAVRLTDQLTDGKLDLLVNNAGSAYLVPLLDADIEQCKKQHDVNVWGVLAVVQAFFPLLRAARGTVVNSANIGGLDGYNRPFAGVYSSSKAAIISLSSTLRIELSPFDVNVVTLISSAAKTEYFNHTTGGIIRPTSIYLPIKDDAEKMMRSSEYASSAPDRYEMARTAVDQLLNESPPSFIRDGYIGTLIAFLCWLLPVETWTLDRLKQIVNGEVDKKDS